MEAVVAAMGSLSPPGGRDRRVVDAGVARRSALRATQRPLSVPVAHITSSRATPPRRTATRRTRPTSRGQDPRRAPTQSNPSAHVTAHHGKVPYTLAVPTSWERRARPPPPGTPVRALDSLRNAASHVTNLASARRYRDMTAVSTVGKLLLTPEEAAGVLSIGRTKLYELLSSDEIVSIRVGTARRIPVEALQHFVDQLLDEQHPDGPRTSPD